MSKKSTDSGKKKTLGMSERDMFYICSGLVLLEAKYRKSSAAKDAADYIDALGERLSQGLTEESCSIGTKELLMVELSSRLEKLIDTEESADASKS